MSTGKLLDRGSEDSSVFARELYVNDKIRVYEGLQTQIEKTTSQNNVSDSSLSEVKTLLDNVKQEILRALNAGMDADDKKAAAANMRGMKENLLTLANESVNGEYIFTGSDTTIRPFTKDAVSGVVTYNGDHQVRKIAVEPNTYRDRGVTGIDIMFYTANEAAGTGTLDFSENEIVLDDAGLEWIQPIATTGNKFTFDAGDTLADNAASPWTLNTTTNTISNGLDTLAVVNLEGNKWQTVDTIDSGTSITSLEATNATGTLRQMSTIGTLTGNALTITGSAGVPPVYTTAAVNTSGAATGTVFEAKHSIFDTVDDVITGLETNDNTVLNGALTTIDSAYDAANVAHSKLGGRNKIFELAYANLTSKLTHFNILSQEVSGADLSKVAMEAKALEMTYTALYSTITKMNSLSLVSFIR
jgi:flagellar hook-associated protein 3 FlgL